ncbi:hypothetical protein Pcinc_004852 [Petrolisthes cinctipes]|uniref:Uncharacterized protein n=1 Tax=Petrolisthes cinctipes TaxID=88211 RepID=A0AAE1GEL5_PETCI|nr:hypothetical protein Pcinc_004852 [Petrolisthes cinctipes]
MVHQYHVLCVGKKKIVEVEEKKQVPSAIVKEFNINHEGELSLQYFDSSWDDWLDVDNLEQLPDKAKLQATIVLSLNEEGEKSEQINCATLSWSGMTPDMPKLQPPSSPVCLESSSHSSQHRNQWPVPFPIKESMFRRAVWDKLNKKVPLNQVERGYVLDGIYEECVRYCIVLDLDSEKKFCLGLNTYSSAITRLPPLKEEHESIQKLRIEAASSTKTEKERKYASSQELERKTTVLYQEGRGK